MVRTDTNLTSIDPLGMRNSLGSQFQIRSGVNDYWTLTTKLLYCVGSILAAGATNDLTDPGAPSKHEPVKWGTIEFDTCMDGTFQALVESRV